MSLQHCKHYHNQIRVQVESNKYVVLRQPQQEQIFWHQPVTDVELIHVHVTRHSQLNHILHILTITN